VIEPFLHFHTPHVSVHSRTGVLVRRDGGSEADAAATAASGRDNVGRRVLDEAQHLRLAAGGVAHHENIDVTTDVATARKVSLLAAKEQAQ